jgi:hypothetical protein
VGRRSSQLLVPSYEYEYVPQGLKPFVIAGIYRSAESAAPPKIEAFKFRESPSFAMNAKDGPSADCP